MTATKRMSLEEFRKQRLETVTPCYICACGEQTNNLCDKCRRPNCAVGTHSHYCATTQAIILG